MSQLTKWGKAMKKKGLPEELIEEILVRLPAKALLRFRCVCKSWLDLIKSPSFVNMHLTRNQDSILVIRGLDLEDKTTNLLSIHSYESLAVISSPRFQIPLFNDIFLEICEPCDGLLCLVHEENIVLCNPIMPEFKELPPSSLPCPKGWDFITFAIGLGFDSITKDYKVVRIVSLMESFFDEVYKAEIYNLSTNCWREIGNNHVLSYVEYTPGFGVLFNGAFHWIASGEDHHYILSFHMSTELFQDVEVPDIDWEGRKCKRLMVLNESLAFFAYKDAQDTLEEQFVDVWVMHQYGVEESWTKQFTVGPLTGICCPFFLWKSEAILMENNEGRLVSCDLNTHEMNDFNIHGLEDTLRVMIYRESLISIK